MRGLSGEEGCRRGVVDEGLESEGVVLLRILRLIWGIGGC